MTASNKRIADAVRDRRDDLVRLTKEFISFPTENPPGGNLDDCQTWICSQLRELDIPFEVIDSSIDDGDHRIIVGTVGDEGPVMYLHGHYDVVPAFAPEQFTAIEKDGSIIGRGACDMKGGLVAMMFAAVLHRDLGGGGRVKLVFVPDEETGGSHGSERLRELGVMSHADAVGAIVAEPSFPDIWYAARGAFTVEVTIAGSAAHVGLHYTGQNAFTEAHAVLGELIAYGGEVGRHRTELRIEPEAARASIMLIGGTASGGTNFNIVPDEFRFSIDRRPNPDEDYEAVRAELIAKLDLLATRYPLSYEILQDVDPAMTPHDDPLVDSVQQIVAEVSERHAPLSMCPGCLETRVYSRIGIPALAYGPGPMAVMHSPDEHVPITNLVEACTVYARVLERHLPSLDS